MSPENPWRGPEESTLGAPLHEEPPLAIQLLLPLLLPGVYQSSLVLGCLKENDARTGQLQQASQQRGILPKEAGEVGLLLLVLRLAKDYLLTSWDPDFIRWS